MKKYNRVMLGKGSIYAEECFNGNFIGTDFDIDQDLSQNLFEDWRSFNKIYIPIYMELLPEKTKIGAGLACGMLWTISKGLNIGDVVLCPNGLGEYYVGIIKGNYYYVPNTQLKHRRAVEWLPKRIVRQEMSVELRHSTSSIGTCCDITKYGDEIERLIAGNGRVEIICSDDSIEDPSAFAMEEHLEEFLVKNWKTTPLGKKYDIYEESGEMVGQQFSCDTGFIDILAISKDKKTLLVIELKKGRASDVVIGQIQRYMGYVKEELAEPNQEVKGIIIAFEADNRIKRALAVTSNIEFFRYQLDFKLHKGV